MLGGLALKRRWQQPASAAGKPADKPNLVMGINVQVCWEKFANYWDVEMRLVPMEGDRFHLSAEEAVKLCDENTIGVVAILGSTFDGSYEPVARDLRRRSTPSRQQTGIDVPVHVDGASGGFVAPFVDPDLEWDFRLAARRLDQRVRPQVRARVPRRRLGRLARRRRAARGPDLLGQLPRRQHADVRAQLLAPRRAGRRAVLQLPAPRLRGLPRGAGLRPRRRHAPVGADRRDRPVRADHARRRAARVRVQADGRRRELHGLRRLERPSRARLAGARLHLPEEPRGPRRAARRRAARVHPRPRRPARRRPPAAAPAPRAASPRRSTTPRPPSAFRH